MWRESEKEKDRLKTSKLVFSGFYQKLAKNMVQLNPQKSYK